MSDGTATGGRPLGMVDRMARTWTSPRKGAASEIAAADEGRLCGYAFLGSALSVMSAVGAQTLNPAAAPAADMAGWVSTQIAAGFFFRTLALYAVAALIALGCRAYGGRGGHRATRAALFWTGLVAAPATLALTLLGAAASGLVGAPQFVADLAHLAGAFLWLALLGPALAEAHGFGSARGVYAGFAAVAVAFTALGLVL